jgi:hypothetical protein
MKYRNLLDGHGVGWRGTYILLYGKWAKLIVPINIAFNNRAQWIEINAPPRTDIGILND